MKDNMIHKIYEVVNHILQVDPELAPSIRELADSVYGNSKSDKLIYGLHGLDEKLIRWLDYDGGYFLVLGANDGID